MEEQDPWVDRFPISKQISEQMQRSASAMHSPPQRLPQHHSQSQQTQSMRKQQHGLAGRDIRSLSASSAPRVYEVAKKSALVQRTYSKGFEPSVSSEVTKSKDEQRRNLTGGPLSQPSGAARTPITPGMSVKNIQDKSIESARCQQTRPKSASSVPRSDDHETKDRKNKRRTRPRKSLSCVTTSLTVDVRSKRTTSPEIIDISSDSGSEDRKAVRKSATTLIEEVLGQSISWQQGKKSGQGRGYYRCRAVLINRIPYEGISRLVFDAKENAFFFTMTKPQTCVPGRVDTFEPIPVPLSELKSIRLCNGRYPYGNFIVMHPSRNIDGLQILEVPPGPDEQLVFFMQDEEFQELANTLKQNTTASVLLGENTIHTSASRICDEYMESFPPMNFQSEAESSLGAATRRQSSRQSKRRQDVEYASDCEAELSNWSKRSRTSDEADELYLRYPVGGDAQDVISIVKGDLKRLCVDEYLNDNLIDLALRIMVAGDDSAQTNAVHVFTCMFYSKMLEAGRLRLADDRYNESYRLVAKWSRGVDIFTKDFVFVPINEDMHWSLAVIVHPGASPDGPGNRPCILYLDSMSMHNTQKIHRYLCNYLQREWDSRQRPAREFNKTTLRPIKLKVPQQLNAFDCGVYILLYAELVLRHIKSSCQEDIDNRFRDYTARFKLTQQDVDAKRAKLSSLLDTIKKKWDDTQRQIDGATEGVTTAEAKTNAQAWRRQESSQPEVDEIVQLPMEITSASEER